MPEICSGCVSNWSSSLKRDLTQVNEILSWEITPLQPLSDCNLGVFHYLEEQGFQLFLMLFKVMPSEHNKNTSKDNITRVQQDLIEGIKVKALIDGKGPSH